MGRSTSVADLPGLGPKSQENLARAGITSVEELRELGSVPAFVRARQLDPRVSLNLLWALESALTGEPWQRVARSHRTSLLLAVDEYERQCRTIEPMHIVPFRPDLAPAFARLNRDWIERLFTMEQGDWRALQDPDREIIQPGGQVFFALHGSRPVGTAAALRVSPERFELAKMAVDPAFQGRGIGRSLGAAVIDFVRSMHADTLFLVTSSRLAGAIRLYERLGFESRPMPFASEYSRADVHMELMLTSRKAADR